MSNHLRPVPPLRPVWCPHDTRKLAEKAEQVQPKPKLREWLWCPMLIAAAILSGLITAPDAKADSYDRLICSVLDEYPTPGGVYGVGLGLIDQGYTAYAAGQKIAAAVTSTCPEHLPEVLAFTRQAGAGKGMAV